MAMIKNIIDLDDMFYENLSLGLAKVLNSIPRITNVTCEKRLPCEKAQVTAWESRHNIYLPDDMKRFYLSTDGFNFYWSYQYSPNDIRRVGHIHIPHLIQITLVRDNIDTILSSSPNTAVTIPPIIRQSNYIDSTSGFLNNLNLNSRSKIFELSTITDLAKVCLVYETPESSNPKIFLLEMASFKWQFLADTFTEYLRMSIAHLGLPYWELCFSSCGLPSWTEQLFLLLAPHLLEKNENRRLKNIVCINENPPYNVLDPAVFRTKPRCSRQSQKSRLNN
ncbi:tubulin polyglutamylase complex subunit 2 isoform X2 [Toxorhynchites rutilus septentrionalis]|uniref:tubulin polyglutamylase complex subunit 2 isoform X2 n=1 Tax=Toxorhynchites rutilus septentrionalis TaxID=329112 RepID=UPI00247A5FAF|nr:tubulin polyglutamylase complex subunit 2 isoform X2 [Toxorhynchites rutilus septentrionalis]